MRWTRRMRLTTNNLLPGEPAREESLPEITALLAERIARYTMGDSTSVRVETAARLLEGIVFCAELHKSSAVSDVPLSAPLSERCAAGAREAKRLAARGKMLLEQAKRFAPPVVNIGYLDTLRALPDFFAQYDADFFAQEMPCSIDYPLSQPVSDALLGVSFVLDYLRRWLVESAFLRALEEKPLRHLYERYYGDYNDLLVNLYLPAAEAAVLCALAGKSVKSLFLNAFERATAMQQICGASEVDARRAINAAAARVCDELNAKDAFARAYAAQTALDLMTRLRAASGRTESEGDGCVHAAEEENPSTAVFVYES